MKAALPQLSLTPGSTVLTEKPEQLREVQWNVRMCCSVRTLPTTAGR